MKQGDKTREYGTLKDHGDEDLPPTYEDSVPWSGPKTIAVVVVQIVLVTLILQQLISEKLSKYSIVPEQVHLSLGNNDNEYYVSWATNKPAECYLVWHKNSSLLGKTIRAELVKSLFEDGSEDQKKLYKNKLTFTENTFSKYFYNARMTVSPGNVYYYYIISTRPKPTNDDYSSRKETIYTSERYIFKAVPYDNSTRPLKIIFYGDLGLLNAQSVPRLTQEVMSYEHDLIIHNGDFAYDLDTDRGEYGDKFMRLMEPIAARLPYQTSVGNHEIAKNFSFYDRRFKMINRGPINNGQTNNFFYSFNAGPIHFVAISTEFYYFLDYVGLGPLVNQYNWLKADLSNASSQTERAKRPWIVVYGHRPMYCSSRSNDDCSKESNLLRRGLPFSGAFALEKLFYDYGVDVELYSHEHQYERFLPIYDGKVYNGTDDKNDPYHNPNGPVHLISGSAGCQEKLDPFDGHPVTGSVKQISDYGYTRIHASRCKLHFEQVSDDRNGTVVDEFTISKNRQNFPPESQRVTYGDC